MILFSWYWYWYSCNNYSEFLILIVNNNYHHSILSQRCSTEKDKVLKEKKSASLLLFEQGDLSAGCQVFKYSDFRIYIAYSNHNIQDCIFRGSQAYRGSETQRSFSGSQAYCDKISKEVFFSNILNQEVR